MLAGMFAALSQTQVPALARAQEPDPATSAPAPPVSRPKLIPWLELNAPETPVPSRPGVTRGQHGLEGLRAWAEVTDIAIVTTRAHRVEDVYADLMKHKPAGLFLIGGIKTVGVLPQDRFADEAGWRRISERARRIAQLTGTNVVVLENETALEGPHTGRADLDPGAVALSLRPLDQTGLEFWWNLPEVLGPTARLPDRPEVTADLVRSVAEGCPGSRFLVSYRAYGHDPFVQDSLALEVRMRELVGPAALMQKLCVHVESEQIGGGRRLYSVPQAWESLAGTGVPAVVIYTGEANWVSVGRAFAALRQRPALTAQSK